MPGISTAFLVHANVAQPAAVPFGWLWHIGVLIDLPWPHRRELPTERPLRLLRRLSEGCLSYCAPGPSWPLVSDPQQQCHQTASEQGHRQSQGQKPSLVTVVSLAHPALEAQQPPADWEPLVVWRLPGPGGGCRCLRAACSSRTSSACACLGTAGTQGHAAAPCGAVGASGLGRQSQPRPTCREEAPAADPLQRLSIAGACIAP